MTAMVYRRASVPSEMYSLQNENVLRDLQAQNLRLHSRVKEMEKINEELRLQIQVQQLQIQLQTTKSAEEEMSHKTSINSYRESLAHMEQENTSLKQDFQSESVRSGSLQNKNQDMQLELTIVKRQLEQYQSVQMENINRRRSEALQRYQLEYEQRQESQRHAGSLGSCGVTESDVVDPSEGYDTVDLGPIVSYPPVPNDALMQSTIKPSTHKLISCESMESSSDSQEDGLECPGCARGFLVSETEQFLQHTENCL